ncbi:MAG TPA: hypothetical protein VG889_11890 [Rhizomicrobium sp.]|nr:hypothetical protein [Rhizomicrobium sp.]
MTATQALGFALDRAPLRQSHLVHRREELSLPSHPDALRLIEAWRECARDGGMRLGRHFPSRRWSKWLAHTALLQKVRCDFRVRLAGFGLMCLHGYDLTGRRLSEIYRLPEFVARYGELDGVLAANRPHVARRSTDWDGETVLAREVVSLPVLACDARTRLVMTVSFWSNRAWLN